MLRKRKLKSRSNSMTCTDLYGKIKNGTRLLTGYWNFTNEEIGVMKDTHLIEYVQDYGGIFFGSRAWGGFRENSDFDYVMPLAEAVKLKNVLSLRYAGDLEITSHNYYMSGYYVKNIVTNTVINVT